MPINQRYDTFFKRLFAGIIDEFIFIPLNWVAIYLFDNQSYMTIVLWGIAQTICWTLYVIIGHGKYGQTLGKRAMAVKVLDLDEKSTIGYKRAFIRESVWFITSIAGSIYYLVIYNSTAPFDSGQFSVDDFLSYTTTIWFILEIITMFFNDKRRALHDLMARSVVIDMDVVKREERFITTQQNP